MPGLKPHGHPEKPGTRRTPVGVIRRTSVQGFQEGTISGRDVPSPGRVWWPREAGQLCARAEILPPETAAVCLSVPRAGRWGPAPCREGLRPRLTSLGCHFHQHVRVNGGGPSFQNGNQVIPRKHFGISEGPIPGKCGHCPLFCLPSPRNRQDAAPAGVYPAGAGRPVGRRDAGQEGAGGEGGSGLRMGRHPCGPWGSTPPGDGAARTSEPPQIGQGAGSAPPTRHSCTAGPAHATALRETSPEPHRWAG